MDNYQGNKNLQNCSAGLGHVAPAPEDAGETSNDPILYMVSATSFVLGITSFVLGILGYRCILILPFIWPLCRTQTIDHIIGIPGWK